MKRFEPTHEQIAAFDDDGFFIAENLLDREEVDLLRDIARADTQLAAGAALRADGEGERLRSASRTSWARATSTAPSSAAGGSSKR